MPEDRKRRTPKPPARTSLQGDRIKDTPANRALFPEATPASVFAAAGRTAVHADDDALVFQGDAIEVLEALAEAGLEVDCIVTSPPFYGQRDYGVEGQLGLEAHPQEFVDKLVAVFAACRRVLRSTGSLWVNLGDTYWSGKGAHKSGEAKQRARRFGLRPQDRPGDGVWTRPKQLLLIPHRFAIAMQEDGWLVRNDNVWIKPRPVPDQVRDRCSMSHEYVFHFTRARWYYFDREAVGRPMASGKVLPPLDHWEVETATGARSAHRASWPEELVRIPILATTPRRGIVLDPFVGSGTTMVFARTRGLRSVGIDLNPAYCRETIEALTRLARG